MGSSDPGEDALSLHSEHDKLVSFGLESMLGGTRAIPRARFPFVVAVVVAHGLFLWWLDSLARPAAVIGLVGGLVAFHALALVVPDSDRARMTRDVASLVVAAVAIAVEGGTESPLFFWMLLFLVAQTLRHSVSELAWLCGIALVLYGAVLVVADDFTAASAGRAMLFGAYCAALLMGLSRLERERARMSHADRLVGSTLNHAPVGVAILGDDGSLRYVNQRGRLMVRVALRSGATIHGLPGAEEGPIRSLLSVVGTAPRGSIDVTLDAGGRRSHLRLAHTWVDAGDQRLLFVFAEDVTTQVQQDRARTRFIEAAAHHFRTPLTPVLAYAELLVDGMLSPWEQVGAAESIRDHARELEHLLEQLTLMLRLRSAPTPSLQRTTVGEVLDRAYALVPGALLPAGVGGELAAPLRTHLDDAARGIAELVSNSMTHGIPPVDVRWHMLDGQTEIRVCDGGAGPDIPHGATFAEVWEMPGSYNTVSPSMGHQLGLARASAHVDRAGGSLSFCRESSTWCFVVQFSSV